MATVDGRQDFEIAVTFTARHMQGQGRKVWVYNATLQHLAQDAAEATAQSMRNAGKHIVSVSVQPCS